MKFGTACVVTAMVMSVVLDGEAQFDRQRVPDDVVVHRDIAYVEGGHERQKLDLYLPKDAVGGDALPLIVWVHGGAWMGGSKSDANPAMRFVEKGYAVASVGYRLSQHGVFPAQIHDCKAAVRWLRAHAGEYGIDGGRIGVWGASAGGHLVALLGTAGDEGGAKIEGELGVTGVSSEVQAVVDWFGPTDLRDMGGGWHDEVTSPESRLVGGPIQEMRAEAELANPIAYVSEGDPPFLIMHGSEDPLVIYKQSELLHAALVGAGVESELVRVEGAGHGGPGFESEGNRGLVEGFFDRWLKGE